MEHFCVVKWNKVNKSGHKIHSFPCELKGLSSCRPCPRSTFILFQLCYYVQFNPRPGRVSWTTAERGSHYSTATITIYRIPFNVLLNIVFFTPFLKFPNKITCTFSSLSTCAIFIACFIQNCTSNNPLYQKVDYLQKRPFIGGKLQTRIWKEYIELVNTLICRINCAVLRLRTKFRNMITSSFGCCRSSCARTNSSRR